MGSVPKYSQYAKHKGSEGMLAHENLTSSDIHNGYSIRANDCSIRAFQSFCNLEAKKKKFIMGPCHPRVATPMLYTSCYWK